MEEQKDISDELQEEPDTKVKHYDTSTRALTRGAYRVSIDNNEAIQDIIEQLVEAEGKTPTVKRIAVEAGVTERTVYNHIKVTQMETAIRDRYKRHAYEIINRHLQLMRQDDDKRVALAATIALEEKILNLVDRTQIEQTEQKKLILEVKDARKQIEDSTATEVTG